MQEKIKEIWADYVPDGYGDVLETILAALKSNVAPVDVWQPIETAPKDEMFIYCRKATKRNPKNSIGLAYHNVAGGVSCAYGDSAAIAGATHWQPLPQPPEDTE